MRLENGRDPGAIQIELWLYMLSNLPLFLLFNLKLRQITDSTLELRLFNGYKGSVSSSPDQRRRHEMFRIPQLNDYQYCFAQAKEVGERAETVGDEMTRKALWRLADAYLHLAKLARGPNAVKAPAGRGRAF
jgi:hypothetical protein